MKKVRQYSDKYGKVVEAGEVVEEREAPGVTMKAAPKAEPKEEPKAEKKAEKKAENKDAE